MARIKINLPETFAFTTQVAVRVSDINYGGHLGNDSILSIMHEARLRFLQQLSYSEMDLEGAGLIMVDAGIEYKGESFYGDELTIKIAATGFHKFGFDLYYHITNQHQKEIARAKTGMLCMNYTTRRLTSLPEAAAKRLETNA